MGQEHFHGYEILSEPGHHGNGDEVHWFNVDRQGSEVYRLEMRIARLYARRQSEFPSTESASELAALLGRRWIHGLIQLGHCDRGYRGRALRASRLGWRTQRRLHYADPVPGDAGRPRHAPEGSSGGLGSVS